MPNRTSPAQRPKQNSHAPSSGKKLQILSRKVIYQGRAFGVTSDKVREPNGIVAQRDVVRHSGSAVILAVDESGPQPRLLLERQYRYAAKDYLWELPAGRIDPGEKPLAGAKRELMEETGYRARQWKPVLFFYPSPGFLDETMTIFLACGLTAGQARPEDDELIESALVSLTKALAMIRRGEIRDGKTICGILWLAQRDGCN